MGNKSDVPMSLKKNIARIIAKDNRPVGHAETRSSPN